MPDKNLVVSPEIGIIGGSGFYDFPDMLNPQEVHVETPYADVLGVKVGQVGERTVAFMARHGSGHRLPPHKINYRANIWALKELGVKKIISINAVGGIDSDMPPGAILLPDQIIDYTYSREHTFVDLLNDQLNHIDFTYPFSEDIRAALSDVLAASDVHLSEKGVYGCTQGPRLETVAEVNRLERDGCNVIGMTGMPEAALARELGMEYGMLCTVVNWAAGRSAEEITLEQIHEILDNAFPVISEALVATIKKL